MNEIRSLRGGTGPHGFALDDFEARTRNIWKVLITRSQAGFTARLFMPIAVTVQQDSFGFVKMATNGDSGGTERSGPALGRVDAHVRPNVLSLSIPSIDGSGER